MSLPKSSRNSTFRWEKRRRDSRGSGLFNARSKQAKISASFCVTSPLYSSSSRFRYSFGLVYEVTKILVYNNSGKWIIYESYFRFISLMLNSHLVFFNSIQQNLPGLAQTSLHLHQLPCQLHSIERCLSRILRRFHGLPQQRLCFIQVTMATLHADPPKTHHGQTWDCRLQGLQDATSFLNVAWPKKSRILLTWPKSNRMHFGVFYDANININI